MLLFEYVATAVGAAKLVPTDVAPYARLSDEELVRLQADLAELRHLIDARAAIAAGEIARRSGRELGFSGLAQRAGHRTPEALVQHITRSTGREAVTLVRVGKVMHETQAARELSALPDRASRSPIDELWLVPVSDAVSSGSLALAAADAIRGGLGIPSDSVSVDDLRDASVRLVQDAQTTDVDRLFARARAARDELDAAGIADREREHRDRRSLRLSKLPDGMIRVAGLLDPESAAIVTDAFDLVTSPRRGGPRWVDETERARADRILDDTRTNEQIMADAFVEMVSIASRVDANTNFGKRRPAVRVLVSADSLRDRRGFGRIEGQADPVSIETVERHACDAGIIPIVIDDDGQCLNVGREQRLFTSIQRIALAARDGGCRWHDCERPPSWTEAHHINQWNRDRGRTDVADGVLLCRYHHMLLHDNHWDIVRRGPAYFLIPPESEDPARTPRPLQTHSAAVRDLLARRRAGR
jgi:hypothetical protein